MKVATTLVVIASLCGFAFCAPESGDLVARSEPDGVVQRAEWDREDKRFLIDVPTLPCPIGQRRDHFGKCRPVFKWGGRDDSVDEEQKGQDKRWLGVNPACPSGMALDLLGRCRKANKWGRRYISADAEEKREDKRFLIDVPTLPCPIGQRRDAFGKCRPIFKWGSRDVSGDREQKREDKRYAIRLPRFCPEGYRLDRRINKCVKEN